MTRRAIGLWALAAVLLSPLGCFVDGTSDPARARITVDLGGVTKGGPVSQDDTVDLAERACYVAASVTAEDLSEPLRTAWACDPGESPGGTVELELDVPAGGERELRVVAFLVEDEGLVTLTAFQREDWPSGVVDVDLDLTEANPGSVDGFITGSDQDITEVRLVDIDTGVLLPPGPVTASGGGFHFTLDRVPQGRFFRLQVHLSGGETREVTDCAIWATAGSVRVVNVDLAADHC